MNNTFLLFYLLQASDLRACLHDRWSDRLPRRVARSARPGYTLSRGQISSCKRFKVG